MVLEFPFNVAWSAILSQEHNLYNQDSSTAVHNDYKVVHFKLQSSDKVAFNALLCSSQVQKESIYSGTCLW